MVVAIARCGIVASLGCAATVAGVGVADAIPYPPAPPGVTIIIDPTVIVFPPIHGGGGHSGGGGTPGSHHGGGAVPPASSHGTTVQVFRPVPVSIPSGGYPIQSRTGQRVTDDHPAWPAYVMLSLSVAGVAVAVRKLARHAAGVMRVAHG